MMLIWNIIFKQNYFFHLQHIYYKEMKMYYIKILFKFIKIN